MPAAASHPDVHRRPRGARGFTLVEVMIALGLLLVGGVSILSVFTLAVVHRVERDVEANIDLLRPEARTMAQEALDRVPQGTAPQTISNREMSVPGYTASITFTSSPNLDPAWVAHALIAYRGRVPRQGRIPPIWLYRSTLDLPK